MDNEKEKILKYLHDRATQSLIEANKYKKEAKNALIKEQNDLTKIFLTRKKMYEREAKAFLVYKKMLEQNRKKSDLEKAKQFLQTLSKANEEKSLLQISSTAQL